MTIKLKMTIMGAGIVAALLLMSLTTYISYVRVEDSVAEMSLRTDQLELVSNMRQRQTELILNAMDAIIDKSEGKVSEERLKEIDDNSKYLNDNISNLVKSADTQEEKASVKVIQREFNKLVEGIRTKLVGLIESSAGKLNQIDQAFDKIDDVLDENGEGLKRELNVIERSFAQRMKSGGAAGEQAKNGSFLVAHLKNSVTELLLTAMDIIVDREDGQIAEGRKVTVASQLTFLEANVGKLQAFLATPEERQAYDRAISLLPKLRKGISEDLYDLVIYGTREKTQIESKFAAIDDELDELSGLIANHLSALQESINEEQDEAKSNMEVTLVTTITLVSTVSLIVIVLTIPAFVLLARNILYSVRRGMEFARKVSQGDLSSRLKLKSRDELAQLGDSLDKMADGLENRANIALKIAEGDLTQTVQLASDKDVLGQALSKMVDALNGMMSVILQQSNALSSHANELSTVSQQLASSSEESRSQAENVAAGAEEASGNISTMAATIEEMSTSVECVSSAAEQLSANMNTVAGAVEELNVSMKEIAEHSNEGAKVSQEAGDMANSANDTMAVLGSAADEIGKVIETIKQIAQQTNLLALNATIEAASAGEAGKGFAVVANEIKELATQSATAAEDITNRIGSMQESATQAVDVITKVAKTINKAKEFVTQISGSVEQQTLATAEIANNVGEANSGVSSISNSIGEISNSSNIVSGNANEAAQSMIEISESVQNVSVAAKQSAEGVTQIQTSSRELAESAENLRTLIAKFKLKEAV